MRITTGAVLLGLLAAGGGRADDDKDKALARLRGTWVCIEQAGNKPKREVMLIIDKAGGYKMGGTGGDSSDIAMTAGVEGTVKLTLGKDPAHIDLVGSKLTLPGLYKLEGDRLTLIVNPEGRRPTSFDKGDGAVHVFIKVKEKK
jgi:uncharacterized protein (TIGR03067 family)